jgi:VWFA-related protein
MKNINQWLRPVSIFFLCITCAVLLMADRAREQEQEQEHKPIVEKVTVTNVEVPVRVLHKGEPVPDLTRDDFILYENGKKMDIHGFFLKRKKIKITPLEPMKAEVPGGPEPVPRTFVLVFNVTSYNKEFQKAVDYLFDKVLVPTDQLMVFINDKTREYPGLRDKTLIKQQLVADLKEESKNSRRTLLQYINRLETYLNVNDFRRALHKMGDNRSERQIDLQKTDDSQPERLIGFLNKYLISWAEYKNRCLIPRTDRFYYFSRFLEKVKGQKWVLNFYQFEFFPRIRLGSDTFIKMRDLASVMSNSSNVTYNAYGRKIDILLNQLETELNLAQNFPHEEITKLFYKVDATFHSFFIRTENPSTMQDFDYKTVSSDLERILKSITDVTGGRNITSNQLVQSLETVSEVEDVYYILTYVPKDLNKKGKLKIKVKDRKCDVLYDDNFRADYISEYLQKLEEKLKTPDIQVIDFSFKNKVLAFTVKDFLMRKIEGQSAAIGRIKVHIRLVDENNNSLFDQAKVFDAKKDEMKISLPAFRKIGKGNYNFLIDAQDMFTGKEANFNENVTVNR